MSQHTTTPVGRLSFPHLVTPSKYMPDSAPRFSFQLFLDKKDPKTIEFVKWVKEAVTAEAKAIGGQTGFAQIISSFTALKDGDNPSLFKTYRPEYQGQYVLNVGRNADLMPQPRFVNREKIDIPAQELYAGCNARASVSVFGYNIGPKKGVSMSFNHIQKTGENTPFSSAPTVDAFSDLDLPPEDMNAGLTPLDTPKLLDIPKPMPSTDNPFGTV